MNDSPFYCLQRGNFPYKIPKSYLRESLAVIFVSPNFFFLFFSPLNIGFVHER